MAMRPNECSAHEAGARAQSQSCAATPAESAASTKAGRRMARTARAVTMARWSFWELQLAWHPTPTLHLVGLVLEEQCGRVTSAVVGVDQVARTVSTASGRRFVLQGLPGTDPDAAYVLAGLRRIGGATSERNVTAEVFPDSAASHHDSARDKARALRQVKPPRERPRLVSKTLGSPTLKGNAKLQLRNELLSADLKSTSS